MRFRRGMIAGVDIGGHHIAVAAVDREAPGRLVAGSYIHRDVDPGSRCDILVSAWAQAIDSVIESVGPERVEGIGIAMPGPFDYRAGIAYFENNAKFRSLYGFDVGAALTAAARHPRPLRFLNDATSFAVGCVAMSAVPTAGRVLGITLGTGLGSAFLDDGIPVIGGADVPDHGCLWHLPFRDGIADDYVSARWLLGEAQTRLGCQFDGVAAIGAAARAGEATAAAIFTEYGNSLATVIAPWLDRFDVGTITMGGRICGAFDLFEGALTGTLGAQGRIPAIAIHHNTEDAAIVGAARAFDFDFWDRAQHRLPDR